MTVRKILIASAAVMAFLVMPAAASADDAYGVNHDVQGRFLGGMNGTYIGFNKKGKQKLAKFSVMAPFVCQRTPVIPNIPLPSKKKSVKIKGNGKFSISYSQRYEGAKMKVKIKGTRKGKRYKGTASVNFRYPGLGKCTSGLMSWGAKKGKRVSGVPAVPISSPATAFSFPGVES